jgi:hypothetical protein
MNIKEILTRLSSKNLLEISALAKDLLLKEKHVTHETLAKAWTEAVLIIVKRENLK